MRDIRTHLEDLQREIDRVGRFTAHGKAVFMAEDRDQYAVMMAYAPIGEIANQLPSELLETQPHIEWRDIKGFPDVLLHRYFEINSELVWAAVEKRSELRTAVEALLASLPPENEA